MTDLTPEHRALLERALSVLDSAEFFRLSDDEKAQINADRAALIALRDACPEPRWLPTEDGLAVHVESNGNRTVYYARNGKVSAYLAEDGLLWSPGDPALFDGTWEPYVHEVTEEQIAAALWRAVQPALTMEDVIRNALPHLGCKVVTR